MFLKFYFLPYCHRWKYIKQIIAIMMQYFVYFIRFKIIRLEIFNRMKSELFVTRTKDNLNLKKL